MNTDNILLLGLNYSVTAISKADGSIVWKTELGEGIRKGFVTVLSDGQHVFAHTGGKLYCLDLADGRILWSNGLSGYGFGLASLCFPNGGAAPDSATTEKIISNRGPIT